MLCLFEFELFRTTPKDGPQEVYDEEIYCAASNGQETTGVEPDE